LLNRCIEYVSNKLLFASWHQADLFNLSLAWLWSIPCSPLGVRKARYALNPLSRNTSTQEYTLIPKCRQTLDILGLDCLPMVSYVTTGQLSAMACATTQESAPERSRL
jgi:hypothetical protein